MENSPCTLSSIQRLRRRAHRRGSWIDRTCLWLFSRPVSCDNSHWSSTTHSFTIRTLSYARFPLSHLIQMGSRFLFVRNLNLKEILFSLLEATESRARRCFFNFHSLKAIGILINLEEKEQAISLSSFFFGSWGRKWKFPAQSTVSRVRYSRICIRHACCSHVGENMQQIKLTLSLRIAFDLVFGLSFRCVAILAAYTHGLISRIRISFYEWKFFFLYRR